MMLTLASQADKNGQVQIGIHNLANICGIAKSTASESVNGLEKTGFLSVIKTRCASGGSLPNTYVIPERFRIVSGELVEPEKLEYQPPVGMTLIDVAELESLRARKARFQIIPQEGKGLLKYIGEDSEKTQFAMIPLEQYADLTESAETLVQVKSGQVIKMEDFIEQIFQDPKHPFVLVKRDMITAIRMLFNDLF